MSRWRFFQARKKKYLAATKKVFIFVNLLFFNHKVSFTTDKQRAIIGGSKS
jgi:hypothetical protein